MENLAHNLTLYRKAARLSRRKAAELAGIKEDTLSTYELKPGQDIYLLPVLRLAKLYGVTLNELLAVPTEPKPPRS